jgi:hypothetical protein
LQGAQEGFPSHGCTLNTRKTTLNFPLGGDHQDHDHDSGPATGCNVYRGADGSCFVRWIGLLINTSTCEVRSRALIEGDLGGKGKSDGARGCENSMQHPHFCSVDFSCAVAELDFQNGGGYTQVQADYTRYVGEDLMAGVNVASTGMQLRLKLCLFMRPKCHPLLFDRRINSPDTARLNAYQACLLCAMKFHCLVKQSDAGAAGVSLSSIPHPNASQTCAALSPTIPIEL